MRGMGRVAGLVHSVNEDEGEDDRRGGRIRNKIMRVMESFDREGIREFLVFHGAMIIIGTDGGSRSSNG